MGKENFLFKKQIYEVISMKIKLIFKKGIINQKNVNKKD